MSASRTPTARPLALSPKARLAATVDLPTPPLPEATATIAFTPATAPRWVRPPAAGCGAFRLDLDREGDIAVANDDPRHHPERDDVGAPVRIGDTSQGVEDLPFGGGGHLVLLPRRGDPARRFGCGAVFRTARPG